MDIGNEIKIDIKANMDIKRGIYRHYKGNLYQVLGLAIHSETLEKMVVYQALYGDYKIWVRPMSMWNNEVEYNGEKVKRFTLILEFKGV